MRIRKFHHPFPPPPSRIEFSTASSLIHCHKSLPPLAYPAGHGFLLLWHTTSSSRGYFTVNHSQEPHRILWSTVPGEAFVTAALGRETVQESRGSITIHDDAQLMLPHQTIEQIQVVRPSSSLHPHHTTDGIYESPSNSHVSLIRKHADSFFQEASNFPADADGHQISALGPAVVVTGCLYGDPHTADNQLKQYLVSAQGSDNAGEMGPFYDINRSKSTRVAARYWLFFWEQRNHHLGFSLKLDHPIQQTPDLYSLTLYHPQSRPPHRRPPQPHLLTQDSQVVALDLLEQMSWLWSRRSLSAFDDESYTFAAKLLQPIATLKRLMSTEMFQLKEHSQANKMSSSVHYELEQSLAATRNDREVISFIDHPTINNHHGEKLNCKLNRVVLTYAAEEDEGFFGFGEQFSYFNLKGRRIPIMVQEQGLGRGDQPITAAVNLVAERSGGDWHTTYAPVPYYITSKMRCVFLEEYRYSVIDLTRRNKVQIQLHGESMRGRIVHGKTPLQLIERYTQAIGRMKKLPDWIIEGAIVGMQGGTQAVHRMWKELKSADVPISAFWLQDWVGQRKTSIGWQLWWNWETDEEHYVGWNQLVKDLKDEGINTMGYFNPFLASAEEKPTKTRHLLAEAKAKGFLVQHLGGSPYMIPNTSFDAAMVDLTNEDAREWLKDVMRSLIKTGVKGWMADFGESLPLDAVLSSREDPKEVHNKYPEMWAKLNREVIDESHDDELVFFMRSAYMRSPRWATLFWEGDQMVSWQRHDGIKSAVVGLLTGGVSGFAFNHSDIGGYCTVDLPFLRYHRSEELLLRWMELNAFSTIFRTHEGNIPTVNHQFHTSATSLKHFGRFAKVYKAWAFYRKQLVKEAAETGAPVVRHMFLHYADDEKAAAMEYQQFLVGREMMVVPVLNKGHKHVWAYFPGGDDREEWIHIWSGKVYRHQPSKVKIPAPIGSPAVFVRSGSAVANTFIHNLRSLHLLPQ